MKDLTPQFSPKLKAEIKRCLNCPRQPCFTACPVGCNPAVFISDALNGKGQKAANDIWNANPFGLTCGSICPNVFCQKACVLSKTGKPIEIVKIQSAILKNAVRFKPSLPAPSRKEKIAVIGAGPAGMSATYFLRLSGFCVTVFEAQSEVGGALNLIPNTRFDKNILKQEADFIFNLPDIDLKLNHPIQNPTDLTDNFDFIFVATGEQTPRKLGIVGENLMVNYIDYLKNPKSYSGKRIAVVGGGNVALDCVISALEHNANEVSVFVRRRKEDMRIDNQDMRYLDKENLHIIDKTVPVSISSNPMSIETCRNVFDGQKWHADTIDKKIYPNFDLVIKAIGCEKSPQMPHDKIFYIGECALGSGYVVEAIASAKQAIQKI